jgi:hypothetical protein
MYLPYYTPINSPLIHVPSSITLTLYTSTCYPCTCPNESEGPRGRPPSWNPPRCLAPSLDQAGVPIRGAFGRNVLAVALSDDGGATFPTHRTLENRPPSPPSPPSEPGREGGARLRGVGPSTCDCYSYPTMLEAEGRLHVGYTYQRRTIKAYMPQIPKPPLGPQLRPRGWGVTLPPCAQVTTVDETWLRDGQGALCDSNA